MWPFSQQSGAVSRVVVDEAMEDMAQIMHGNLNETIQAAMQKAVDVSHLQYIADGSDDGGHWGQEFDLRATAGRLKALYTREPWVYSTAQLIARTMGQIPFLIKDLQGNIIDTHPLMEQINAGSTVQDSKFRDWSGNLDLCLGGNYFMVFDEKYEKAFHIPVELAFLKMRDTNTSADDLERFGMIESLQILEAGTMGVSLPTKEFPWSQVVHIRTPNPYNPFYGLSMYAAAARPIMLDRYKNEFEMAFYLRGATNAGVITTNEEVTRSRMERLMKSFENSFTGRRNWWRTLFLPKGAQWTNSGLTMSEMQHLEGLRENRLTLLATLGIPPSQVGIVQDVNRATAETQESQMWNNTIIPLSWFTASGWNSSYLVRIIYKGEVVVEPDLRGIDAVEGSLLSRSEQARSVDNMVTINEQREIIGYKVLPPNDIRGEMFLIELQKQGLGNPFGEELSASIVAPAPTEPDSDTLRLTEGQTQDGTGENRHSHPAKWDDETGNGETTGTQGDGPAHSHKIADFKVLPGGEDGHEHGAVKSEDSERAFQAAKANSVQRQSKIERVNGKKYKKGLDAYFDFLFQQVRVAAEKDIDIRAHLATMSQDRQDKYIVELVPILDDTMNDGFELALATTKSISNELWLLRLGYTRHSRKKPVKKLFRFTATDEQAISNIKERTKDGARQRLAERGVQMFQGFDSVATENIMNIIEVGLREGKAETETARDIRNLYGEFYQGQSTTITRTEILSAVSAGTKWNQDVLGEVFTEVNKQWFHVGDVGSNPNARAEHLEFQQEGEVPKDHIYSNPDTGNNLSYPRDPAGGASDVINCRCSMTAVIPASARSNADQII